MTITSTRIRVGYKQWALSTLLLLTVAATGCTTWAQWGFGAGHAGYNPNETTLGPANVAGLELRWSQTTIGQFGGSSPLAANGLVFTPPKEFGISSCCITLMWGYGATTGTAERGVSSRDWPESPTCAPNRVPAVVGTTMYVPSSPFQAIAVGTGYPIWEYRPAVQAPAAATRDLSCSSVTVDDQTLVERGDYSSLDANGLVLEHRDLVALDARTGTARWTVDTGERASFGDAPAIAGGLVYVMVTQADQSHQLKAFDEGDGTSRWSRPVASFEQPVVSGGTVYVNGPSGVAAFNATTGTPTWTRPDVAVSGAGLAVANGTVYVPQAGGAGLVALDSSTGATRWTRSVPVDATSKPAVANGVVYVGGSDSKLYALNALTGIVLAALPTPAAVGTSPIVAGGWVYVSSDDGTLSAFGLPA